MDQEPEPTSTVHCCWTSEISGSSIFLSTQMWNSVLNVYASRFSFEQFSKLTHAEYFCGAESSYCITYVT
jgi:hypothetical protein